MRKIKPLLFILAALLCACGGLSKNQARIDVVANAEYIRIGSGSPVIVFENGMGVTMDTWKAIMQALGATHRLFAYHRPGYGKSPVAFPLRNAGDIVAHLRKILRKTGHYPPYILVGHSLGGIYVNLFARMYPREVSGVLFIDASHPRQYAFQKKHDPWFSIAEFAAQGKDTYYEHQFMETIADDIKKAGPFPQIPLIVLTSEKQGGSETPATRRQWLRFQRDLASLSEKSEQRIVKTSGHFVYLDRPDVVIQAIQKLAGNGAF